MFDFGFDKVSTAIHHVIANRPRTNRLFDFTYAEVNITFRDGAYAVMVEEEGEGWFFHRLTPARKRLVKAPTHLRLVRDDVATCEADLAAFIKTLPA